MEKSALLLFAEGTLQEIALVIMAVVYTTRLLWLFKFNGVKERQPATGRVDTTRLKGSIYSLFNIIMPWGMESTRTKPLFYAQFVMFHVGVVAAIGLSFVIPYLPGLLTPTVAMAIQGFCFLACAIGVLRLIRRATNKHVRAISTPDDFFSLILLTVWFAFAGMSAHNPGGTIQLTYFILTAFFLIYVPFSKISHYLYYPFTRWWLGRTMGHRGVFPLQLESTPASAGNLQAQTTALLQKKGA
jgi:nitrate reductase gamma subunit